MSVLPKRVIRVRLPAGVTAEEYLALRHKIEAAYGERIEMRINDNFSTLISWKQGALGKKRLSLHRMFMQSDEGVVSAIGQYLRRPTPRCRQVLREFMNKHHQAVHPTARKKVITLRARGAVYDLNVLSRQVNDEFFAGTVQAYITWSRGNALRRRLRHITFGTYEAKSRVIRIHPILDQIKVPEFFVKFVIYHEMLHAVLDPEHSADGRRYVHTAEFRRRERLHPHYAEAMQFEKDFMKAH